MAVLSFAADKRKEGVGVNGKRAVDVTLTAAKGVAADTLNPATLGLSQIDEVWVKIATTGTVKTPAIAAALPIGTVRIYGS